MCGGRRLFVAFVLLTVRTVCDVLWINIINIDANEKKKDRLSKQYATLTGMEGKQKGACCCFWGVVVGIVGE